jgi:hypothetical protein
MNEDQFWTAIEAAWQKVGGYHTERSSLALGKLSEANAEKLVGVADEVVAVLRTWLDTLSPGDLLAFDRILERKLYDIDRAEVQRATDGGDDGFLYARGLIIAAGKAYFDAVNQKPSTAMMGLQCEDMCYLSWHLYQEKFGELPESEISRESCSNAQGWEK